MEYIPPISIRMFLPHLPSYWGYRSNVYKGDVFKRVTYYPLSSITYLSIYNPALSQYCLMPNATTKPASVSQYVLNLQKKHNQNQSTGHLPTSTTSHLTSPALLPFAPSPTSANSQLRFALPARSKLGVSSLICLYCLAFLAVYGG